MQRDFYIEELQAGRMKLGDVANQRALPHMTHTDYAAVALFAVQQNETSLYDINALQLPPKNLEIVYELFHAALQTVSASLRSN